MSQRNRIMLSICILAVIIFLPRVTLAGDAIFTLINKCDKDYAIDRFGCYEWLGKKNSYELIQTGRFHEFMREEYCCAPLTIALYDTLFSSNSFVFNSSTKIDSLFSAIVIEIGKLPTHHWLNDNLENCKTITIPKSLFVLLNKTEQDSLHSMVTRNIILNVTDSLFEVYEGNSRYENFPPVDIIACLIRASIEQEPDGEYTLLLNNTPYKMAKISDNHYVVRIVKETCYGKHEC
jgi:hypothetical protein